MPRAKAASPTIRVVAWSVFGFIVVSAAPFAAYETGTRLFEASRHAGESSLDSRRRKFGPGYADGIEAIRQRLPRNETYLLAEGARSDSFLWVQYDLAPRRARLVQDAYRTPDQLRGSAMPEPRPEWVVIAMGNDAPRLVPSREFFATGPAR